ncbi:MAG: hypothetical protein KAS07_04360 [Candidatus Pacebacteria bacterium]|nr:hypothetical protein [Candidatus Paceibacterota bacterium]
MIRIIYTTLLFAAVLFFPWWVVTVFAVGGVMMYPRYYECVVAGVFLDLLFATFSIPIMFTVGSIVLFVIGGYFKRHVRVYE